VRARRFGHKAVQWRDLTTLLQVIFRSSKAVAALTASLPEKALHKKKVSQGGACVEQLMLKALANSAPGCALATRGNRVTLREGPTPKGRLRNHCHLMQMRACLFSLALDRLRLGVVRHQLLPRVE